MTLITCVAEALAEEQRGLKRNLIAPKDMINLAKQAREHNKNNYKT